MDFLPDLVLDKIFHYCPFEERFLSLDLVCNRWNQLMPYKIKKRTTKNDDERNTLWDTSLDIDELMSFVNEMRPYERDNLADFDFLAGLLNHVCGKIGDHLDAVRFGQNFRLYDSVRGSHVQAILSNSPWVSTVKFGSRVNVQSDAIDLLPMFTNLERLVIRGNSENEEALANALVRMNSLTRLKLYGSFGRDLLIGGGSSIVKITLASLQPFHNSMTDGRSLAQQWPRLRHLNCSEPREIASYTDEQFVRLLVMFPALQSSNLITGCYGGDLNDKSYLKDAVSALTIIDSIAQGPDAARIHAPPNQFPSLKRLTLIGCKLTPVDVRWSLMHTNLESLKIDHCFFVPTSQPRLDASLPVLCKRLKHLNWSEGTWSEMKSAVPSFDDFGDFTSTQRSSSFNSSESDFVFGTILSNCYHLKSIVIDAYYPELVQRLVAYATMSRAHWLRYLRIRLSNMNYKKTSLQPLTTVAWPSVRHLTFVHEGDLDIDIDYAEHLAASFPNLRRLSLHEPYVGGSGIEIIPASSACAFVTRLPKLKELVGIRLPNYPANVNGIFECIASEGKLTSLSCTNFSRNDVQRARLHQLLFNAREKLSKTRRLRQFRLTPVPGCVEGSRFLSSGRLFPAVTGYFQNSFTSCYWSD